LIGGWRKLGEGPGPADPRIEGEEKNKQVVLFTCLNGKRDHRRIPPYIAFREFVRTSFQS